MSDIGATRCRSWHGHVNRTTTVSLSGDQLSFAAGSPAQVAIAEIIEVHDDRQRSGGGKRQRASVLILRTKDGDVGMMTRSG